MKTAVLTTHTSTSFFHVSQKEKQQKRVGIQLFFPEHSPFIAFYSSFFYRNPINFPPEKIKNSTVQ
ncbi:MAG: hypothetical protein KF704_15865 [Crocinitomicaceae bacterium]|uniref:hypothetical protein n=1 Tax=Taishania pollutisoli TaxID=2766479 RepID=UPI001C1DF99C|nr:hypothetical protein [Taishania pollutisoli]MBX2950758.1 hypothetical protein [Crocinitomicaceae bacterium]